MVAARFRCGEVVQPRKVEGAPRGQDLYPCAPDRGEMIARSRPGGIVVDHDDFRVGARRAGGDRGEAGAQRVGTVAGRDHDRDARLLREPANHPAGREPRSEPLPEVGVETPRGEVVRGRRAQARLRAGEDLVRGPRDRPR